MKPFTREGEAVMRMGVSKQARIRFASACVLFVLVAATIYVSAASRQGPQETVTVIDVKNPVEAREALLFDPFESPQPIQATDPPTISAAEQTVDIDVALAADVLPAEAGITVQPEAQDQPEIASDLLARRPAGRPTERDEPTEKDRKKGGAVPLKAGKSGKFLGGGKWTTLALVGGGLGVVAGVGVVALGNSGGGSHRAVFSPAEP